MGALQCPLCRCGRVGAASRRPESWCRRPTSRRRNSRRRHDLSLLRPPDDEKLLVDTARSGLKVHLRSGCLRIGPAEVEGHVSYARTPARSANASAFSTFMGSNRRQTLQRQFSMCSIQCTTSNLGTPAPSAHWNWIAHMRHTPSLTATPRDWRTTLSYGERDWRGRLPDRTTQADHQDCAPELEASPSHHMILWSASLSASPSHRACAALELPPPPPPPPPLPWMAASASLAAQWLG